VNGVKKINTVPNRNYSHTMPLYSILHGENVLPWQYNVMQKHTRHWTKKNFKKVILSSANQDNADDEL
jgi:hypothetical protein